MLLFRCLKPMKISHQLMLVPPIAMMSCVRLAGRGRAALPAFCRGSADPGARGRHRSFRHADGRRAGQRRPGDLPPGRAPARAARGHLERLPRVPTSAAVNQTILHL